MTINAKGLIIGALALAGAFMTTAEADAMPVQPLTIAAASPASVEPVYFYGYRRPFFRYGYRRPFLGFRPYYGYGFRRPYYGYRRPFYRYGYGFRRF